MPLAGLWPSLTHTLTLSLPPLPVLLAVCHPVKNANRRLFAETRSVDYLAIYTEHVPTEFEYVTHYLFDGASGVEIEPTHEMPEADEADKVCGRVCTFIPWASPLTLALVCLYPSHRLFPPSVALTAVRPRDPRVHPREPHDLLRRR